MKRLIATLVFLSTIGIGLSVHAYPVPGHILMTKYSVRESVLYDREFVEYLGVLEKYRTDNVSNETDEITISIDENNWASIDKIVTDGVAKEDSTLPPKMLHHFFDVQNNGESYKLGSGGSMFAITYSSKEWSLEANGSIENWTVDFDQEFSYTDALDYFEKTFSGENREERLENFGLTLSTMGHLVHHIQDMAQPEHSRNDNHFDTGKTWQNTLLTEGEKPIVQEVSHSLFESTVRGDVKSTIEDPYSNNKYQQIDIRKFDKPGDFGAKMARQ